MLSTQVAPGFAYPGAAAHGPSSIAWISATRGRVLAGMHMSRKQKQLLQGFGLSFLRFDSLRSSLNKDALETDGFKPTLSRLRSPSLCQFQSRDTSVETTAVSANFRHSDATQSRSWVDHAGREIFRASLLALACAILLFPKKMALAAALAKPGTVEIPSLTQLVRNGLSWLSPKLVQVWEVFRDQGMVLCLLLGLSAFFSMAETSITTLWPWKVRELAEKEKGGDGVFQLLRQDVTRFLTTILIGTTVANIAATALVTDAATALFGEAGVTAATGVMTVVILLLTEITPKSIAVHNATEVARIVVRPVAWLSYVLYPAGRVVTAISMGLLKLLGLKSSGEPFVTEEELKLMLRGAELSGAIEEEEQDMIENVLEIKDTYVREVMTPLVDVVAIGSSATVMDFRNLWVTHQYSRVPVFERRVDNIVGIAYAMDMLDYVEQVEVLQKLTVGRIAHKPAYFVPDSMSVWNLLREFRIRKVHMAIVLNEYGGTVGVVTLEDVVEEIVGEIFDENDSKEEIRRKTGYIVQRADGVFDVDANTSIEDITEALEVKPPEVPYHYETVSGFVCEAFGYIPRTGESINVILKNAEEENAEGDSENSEDRKEKLQKYRLEILAGNARKVGSVRFERLKAAEDHASLGLETRLPVPLGRQLWEEKRDIDDDENEGDSSWELDGDSEASASEDDEQDSARAQNLIAESIDVDSPVDPEVLVPTTDGLPFMGDQECDLSTMTERRNCDLENYGTDVSTATAIDTLYSKWEKQRVYRERRSQRRRKYSNETTVELDRNRKFFVKRKESETIKVVRKQNEEKK